MYYHILIESIESGKTIDIIKPDVTDKTEIIDNILIPYLKEEEFFIDGYNLRKLNIKRLKIVSTKLSRESILEYEYSKIPPGAPPGAIIAIKMKDVLFESKNSYITSVTNKMKAEANDKIANDGEKLIEKTAKNDSKIIADVQNMVTEQKSISDKNKVFIVHGHDGLAKETVARFIEKLKLEAIILHEQVNSGMTIIDKIEEYSNVGYSIILYTPCDIGYTKDKEDKKMSRARQNVVFEHGYMTAKLGRQNVCILVKGDIEKPNDISGIVYTAMDDNDGWKSKLAKELKKSGYNVDLNDII